jgi:microcystin degradation protein MlrC
LQRFLGKRAHSGGLRKLSTASGSDAAARGLRFGGLRERESREIVLLAPRVDLPADGDVGDEYFVLKRLIHEGRSVVLLEPVLDVEAVVRAPIRRDNRVVHQNALKRHVLQLLCN